MRRPAALALLAGVTPPSVRRPVLACLAACVALSGLVSASGAAAEEAGALDLLERARVAAQTQSYEGLVVVDWREGQRHHSEEVRVRCSGGVLRLGDEVVGAGARRMVQGTDGWLSLWGHHVVTLGPSPTTKYDLVVEPGPEIAGRPTEVVAVRLREATRTRERLYVDRRSGLVLRRELLDAHGSPYRSVTFTRISHAGVIEVAAAGTPEAVRSSEPEPARDLKTPFRLKASIDPGYHRVGAYRANGVVHQFFSDGLHGLSVFEQRGQLKKTVTGLAGEAGQGREVEIAGRTMQAFSGSVGEAVVWESDGVVYTAVTDAPWSDLAAAVEDLPHTDPPGRLRRLAQTVVSLFRWR